MSTRPVAEVRQRSIVTMLRETGSLRASELAETFDVSEETVRRDLVALEERGLLIRTRGGAIAEQVHKETSFQKRLAEHHAEKVAIGRAAAQLIQDGSTIMIDSGSTMRLLIPFLAAKRDLVVITSGIGHVEPLLRDTDVEVVVTGGVVRRNTGSATGELAVRALSGLRADHTFLAASNFSADAGITYPRFDEVSVKRAMIKASPEVTLLADGSKCGGASMVQVAPLTAADRIITSPPIPDEQRAQIAELSIELLVVEASDESDLG